MKSITGSVKANMKGDGGVGGGEVMSVGWARHSLFARRGVVTRGRGRYRISTWAGRRTPLAAIICSALSFSLACLRFRLIDIADLIKQFF